MPIDKILEQVADDERDIVSQKSNEEQLVSGAKSILEKYLTQFFQGELPGQQTSLELDTQTRKAITTLGSDLFAIYPTKTRYDFYLKINLLNITDPRDIECIIRKMYGNEALKTDLYSFVDGSNPKKLEEILPEFKVVKNKLINCKIETAIQRTTLHPQLIVMSLIPEDRPLTALAIERSINKGTIDLSGCANWRILSHAKKLNILEQFMPSTKDFLETASTYNCKTILSNLMALETAIEKYTRCIS